MDSKLMPMRAACTIRALCILAVTASVVGCATRTPKSAPIAPSVPAHAESPALGHAYQVLGGESLLIVRVYRGGTLSRAGHNHIVASHDLAGTIYVAPDLSRSSFELQLPVASLTVDEAELRAAQGADFAADVPDSAREGTRKNMLGPAVLDAEHYPQISLFSDTLDMDAGRLMARVQIRIRGETHVFTVPVTYTLSANELLAQGEFALKQTDLGLAPFTALLGALAVQDEMQLQFRIVARADVLKRS
jgi:polyisoprenoid-binding protein YceI